MRYCCTIRTQLSYRRDAFERGLQAAGLKPGNASNCDVFVTWNRIHSMNQLARQVEARGGVVLVAENAAWGKGFLGEAWFSLARTYHNTAGMFPVGGPERWDSLGVDLAPWRPDGGETVGLTQRGIGSPPTAQPRDWHPPGCDRIRAHPGVNPCVPLETDLARASRVVTWGSGAAIKALMLGIKVESHMPRWIGEQDNTDAGRLNMLRSLAWAQWRMAEIESGETFARLLGD